MSVEASADAAQNIKEVCYLCSQTWPTSKMGGLFTIRNGKSDNQMYFPFIRELRRPQGARPLNPDGSVRVCIGCYGNLQGQWQRYESENIPQLHRRYSLLPNMPIASSSSSSELDQLHAPVKRENVQIPSSLTKPLNIDVTVFY